MIRKQHLCLYAVMCRKSRNDCIQQREKYEQDTDSERRVNQWSFAEPQRSFEKVQFQYKNATENLKWDISKNRQTNL